MENLGNSGADDRICIKSQHDISKSTLVKLRYSLELCGMISRISS